MFSNDSEKPQRQKKTGILERRYGSKPVISDIVRGHRLTKEESDLVAIQDPVDTVDILIEPILTRRALNGFEAAVCAMKKEEEMEKKTIVSDIVNLINERLNNATPGTAVFTELIYIRNTIYQKFVSMMGIEDINDIIKRDVTETK